MLVGKDSKVNRQPEKETLFFLNRFQKVLFISFVMQYYGAVNQFEKLALSFG